MRKKLMSFVLVGSLTAAMLAGCGDASKAPEGATTTSSAAAASSAPASSASAPSSAASSAASAASSAESTAAATEDWVTKFTDGSTKQQAPVWTDYDNLINEIRKDTDLADRVNKMHEAETMLMSTGAVMPIYYYNDLYLENPSFSGDFATIFGTKYFMYAKKDGQPTSVMKINLASEPDHLDPQLNSSVDGAALAANSFVGLYTPDPTDPSKAVAALADGDPQVSEDGTEYTIKMKSDLKWSDGTPLNANDIVESWLRAADPNTASDYSYLFAVFDGYSADGSTKISVDAPDDNTVHFKLAAPCPYMMNLLEFPVFMPVPKAARDIKAGDDAGTWAQEAGFVTNGAFTLKNWKHNESMVYVKNPNYYDAANVSVDELDFMLSADDTAIFAAYNKGNLDYADTVPNDEIKNLKDKDDFHVIDNLGTYYVGFNVNSAMFDGKTADQAAEMRRALSLLIDRQYIIDSIAQTEQKVATSFIPEGMSDGNGGVFKSDAYSYPDSASHGYFPAEFSDANLDKARKMLEDCGYKFDDSGMLDASTPIQINYLTNEGTSHEQIAQAIQQDVAAIGITMNISVEDWQTFLNDRKAGNFDVAREGWLADYDDPINMLEMFTSDSGNNDMQLGK